MRNYVQPGEILTLTAPYAVTAGQGALVGAAFGVAINDVANAAAGEFGLTGVFDLTKAAGASTGGAQGAAAFWNNSTRVVTAVSSGNTRIGVFANTVADGDLVARVRLNGSF
ncbi:DUF2190 family protein [Sandarakinorhabdus sp.]|uniref:DUF2190 family protein n=1 Tax=Sandarakinorhabdus sp. TaxID=1916663 RepID=UPI00286E53F3|nr:DUF2190 family protein [Sandarakinorhabdus sp.]